MLVIGFDLSARRALLFELEPKIAGKPIAPAFICILYLYKSFYFFLYAKESSKIEKGAVLYKHIALI